MSSLSFVQKTFDWGGEMFLAAKCRDWATIAPNVSMLKSPDFKTNIGYFSTLDLTGF